MPFDTMDQSTEGWQGFGGRPGGEFDTPTAPQGDMATGGATQPPGGPGVDTPQEQQAVQLLMQGALLMRRATEIEPSIRYIIDDLLQKAYLGITKHYGMEQEGKLALQQAQLQANKGKSAALMGPPTHRPQPRPPVGEMGM